MIVLSGRGSDADRLRGFLCGADDYVVKPFAVQEVVARMRAVLRRRDGRRRARCALARSTSTSPAARSGSESARSQLANKEFSLLRTLASDPTRVFTKEELLRDVWGFRSMGRTRTLDSHASRLRRKLDPDCGRYVVNCWGVGYRLVDGPEADARGDRR